MRIFKADLHIHTCLSPCGDLMMSPKKIVAEVLRHDIDIIAISDHNSAKNVSAVKKAAEGTGIVVLPGMEVCTREEVHLLAIFEHSESAFAMQSFVYDRLHGENDPDAIGLQVIATENDEVEDFEPKLLIGAADVSLDKAVEHVHMCGGIAIASHIDRESFSVIGQLGFIPETVTFDALEISANSDMADARTRFSQYREYPFVRNSDAHFLSDIGNSWTAYRIEEPTFAEIRQALRKEFGRSIVEVT